MFPRNDPNAPNPAAAIPSTADSPSNRCIRSVSKYAVAAGMISIADTKTTPTACIATMIANAVKSMITPCNNPIFNPSVWPNPR